MKQKRIKFYFILIYYFSYTVSFFMEMQFSYLYCFTSAQRTSFNNSCKIGLLVMNSVFICISPLFLKGNFTEYIILNWWVFLSKPEIFSSLSLLA